MQITPLNLSFKSAFRYLNNVHQEDTTMDLLRLASANFIEQPRYDIESLKQGVVSEMFVGVGDNYDKEIETMLKSRGIDFQKRSFKETLDPNDINLRMILTPFDENQGRKLVKLDVEKLESAFQNSDFYLTQEDLSSYEFEHYQKVYNSLKLGSLIDAPSICLKEENDKLVADFIDGRHRFCIIRDLGAEDISIAIDNDSIELAKKYGLLKL